MFDRALNTPLDHLSCFTMILSGMHSKLTIFPHSEVIHRITTFKLTKGWQNKGFCSFFHFLPSIVPDNKCQQNWRVLIFTRIEVVARVLACARAIACIKWRILIFEGQWAGSDKINEIVWRQCKNFEWLKISLSMILREFSVFSVFLSIVVLINRIFVKSVQQASVLSLGCSDIVTVSFAAIFSMGSWKYLN